MRNLLVTILITTFSIGLQANDDKEAIQKVVQEFSKAGDDRNLAVLEELTSVNYRIVMNQLFGSDEISVMDRKTYLDMIKQKKFGGDERIVVVHAIVVSGNNASVDVTFNGKAMNVRSLMSLSKDNTGKWKLISDTPTVI